MRDEPRSLEGTREEIARRRRDFDQGVAWRYALWLEQRLVGGAMLIQRPEQTLELGYWLVPEATGQGLATEAARALVELAWRGPVRRVLIRCDARNHPSIALPRRLGATHTETELLEGPVELQHWVLLRELSSSPSSSGAMLAGQNALRRPFKAS